MWYQLLCRILASTRYTTPWAVANLPTVGKGPRSQNAPACRSFTVGRLDGTPLAPEGVWATTPQGTRCAPYPRHGGATAFNSPHGYPMGAHTPRRTHTTMRLAPCGLVR